MTRPTTKTALAIRCNRIADDFERLGHSIRVTSRAHGWDIEVLANRASRVTITSLLSEGLSEYTPTDRAVVRWFHDQKRDLFVITTVPQEEHDKYGARSVLRNEARMVENARQLVASPLSAGAKARILDNEIPFRIRQVAEQGDRSLAIAVADHILDIAGW